MRPNELGFRSRTRRERRGAITLLTAIVVPVLLVLTAFAVNVAYMQMIREQLRVACDSSAKAALVSYGATQSTATAIACAQGVANLNPVAGTPLTLSAANVLFGYSQPGSSYDAAYTFSPTVTANMPLSVQVNYTASAPLFLTTFLPLSTFTPMESSTVTQISCDVILVLDRSASMAFDMTSTTEFNYPGNLSGLPLITNYFTPPLMPQNFAASMPYSNTSTLQTCSRWASLVNAVYAFIGVLQSRNMDVHVGLVTYAETFTFGDYSTTEAGVGGHADVHLTANYATALETALSTWSQDPITLLPANAQPLLGDTNIEAGLDLAAAEFQLNGRSTADRTIILLTDGVATTGNTDIPSVATSIRTQYNTVINTIAFSYEAGTSAAQSAMQGAATNGNGQFYYAPTTAELQSAFTAIANSLPAVLVRQGLSKSQ